MTNEEVNLLKQAILDSTEAYVDTRFERLPFVKTEIGVIEGVGTNKGNKVRYYFAMPKEWITFTNAKACDYSWDGTDKCTDWQHSYQMKSTPIEKDNGTKVYYVDVSVDVSSQVQDGFMESAILKGQTLVNLCSNKTNDFVVRTGSSRIDGDGRIMGIQCIALDLDRTTLNGEGKLSKENREAIQNAICPHPSNLSMLPRLIRVPYALSAARRAFAPPEALRSATSSSLAKSTLSP